MAITVSFAEVERKNFDPIPEGTYFAIVDKAEEVVSKQGNDMLNVTFKVTDGDFTGRFVFDHFVFTPKALWRFENFLLAIGAIDNSASQAERAWEGTSADLVGSELRIKVVITEQDEYAPRNDVKSYLPM